MDATQGTPNIFINLIIVCSIATVTIDISITGKVNFVR